MLYAMFLLLFSQKNFKIIYIKLMFSFSLQIQEGRSSGKSNKDKQQDKGLSSAQTQNSTNNKKQTLKWIQRAINSNENKKNLLKLKLAKDSLEFIIGYIYIYKIRGRKTCRDMVPLHREQSNVPQHKIEMSTIYLLFQGPVRKGKRREGRE